MISIGSTWAHRQFETVPVRHFPADDVSSRCPCLGEVRYMQFPSATGRPPQGSRGCRKHMPSDGSASRINHWVVGKIKKEGLRMRTCPYSWQHEHLTRRDTMTESRARSGKEERKDLMRARDLTGFCRLKTSRARGPEEQSNSDAKTRTLGAGTLDAESNLSPQVGPGRPRAPRPRPRPHTSGPLGTR